MNKIVFVTTLSEVSSTMIGRVVPLAKELAADYEVHILDLSVGRNSIPVDGLHLHSVGREPFTRTSEGKKRLHGAALLSRMVWNAVSAAVKLVKLQAEYVVIVKPLPQNALALVLAKLFIKPKKIILDVDDFELTANVLSSLGQRAAVHWGERVCARYADVITVATPFLADHMEQLTRNEKPVHLLPTGLSFSYTRKELSNPPTLLYIGSISSSSGHTVDLLPEMLEIVTKTMPNVRLHMVGGGDDIESLKVDFAKRGLAEAVEWHGRFSPQNISKFLDQASILIDPVDASISNRAKSSYRVALSLAAGLPVVTSNIGIRGELIPRQFHDQLFAEPGNATSYAEKVKELLEHAFTPEELAALQTQSKKYTWSALAGTFKTYL